MNRSLKVAAVQFGPTAVASENRAMAAELVGEAAAAGARLVVLPEEAMLANEARASFREDVAAAWTAWLELLSGLSRASSAWIIAGAYEPVENGAPHNVLVAFDADGVQRAHYRKLHLYDAFAHRESDSVQAGDALPPVVLVDGVAVGLVNCYDLRFPELSRDLILRGADVLSVSAAWVEGPRKEDHWRTLLRARAIENTCWVIASSSTSPSCIGESAIVDPLGVEVAAVGPAPRGIAYATVALDATARVRETLPVLANRRLEMRVRVMEADR